MFGRPPLIHAPTLTDLGRIFLPSYTMPESFDDRFCLCGDCSNVAVMCVREDYGFACAAA